MLSSTSETPSRSLTGSTARRTAYALLIVVAASVTGARLLTAPAFFSVNDQSRWSTVRALVDTGSYAIGRRYERANGRYDDRGIISEPGWDTVDKVMHPDTKRFYSSKPTLLPTVLAGEYWLLRRGLNLEFARHREAVVRTILFTINWLPFVLYLVVFARLIERLGTTDWGRLFVFSTAGFGTFVSGFLPGLNNHTVAATGVLFALYHCLRIQLDDDRRWWRFALSGLFAGWAFANELPALAFAAGLMLWLMRLSRRDTVRFAMPGLLLPMAALLYTQYEALGSLVPAYGHEEWYQYAGSYWRNPTGIDAADESKLLYAFNLLAGHTGILSLSPVFVLGWIGMFRLVRWRPAVSKDLAAFQILSLLAVALTAITFVLYVVRSNNYGGITSGARWFFWLVPLWLLTSLPEADRWAAVRWRRLVAGVLLAISIGSASYALENPWRYSWLFVWLEERGIIAY